MAEFATCICVKLGGEYVNIPVIILSHLNFLFFSFNKFNSKDIEKQISKTMVVKDNFNTQLTFIPIKDTTKKSMSKASKKILKKFKFLKELFITALLPAVLNCQREFKVGINLNRKINVKKNKHLKIPINKFFKSIFCELGNIEKPTNSDNLFKIKKLKNIKNKIENIKNKMFFNKKLLFF